MDINKSILFQLFDGLRNLKLFSSVSEDVIYNSFFHLLFIKAIYKIPALQSLVGVFDDEWDLLRIDPRSKEYFISQLFPELIESKDKNIRFYFENSYKDFKYLDDETLLRLYKLINLIPIEKQSPIERYEIIEQILDLFSQKLGKNGYSILSERTPKMLRDFVTKILDPKIGEDRIADLTCGTGSLLLSTYMHNYNKFTAIKEYEIYGVDINKSMINIFIMHSYISGVYNISIEQKNILKELDPWFDRYDKIYSDTSLGLKVRSEEISPSLRINTRNADVLFLEATMMALSKSGTAAVITSKSLLFSSSSGHLEVRKQLVDEMHIEAIVSLPVKLNYTSIPLVLVVFKNIVNNQPILFMDLDRDINARSDIELITKRLSYGSGLYHSYCSADYDDNIALGELSDLCWFVDKNKIRDNDYILDITFYQPEVKINVLPIRSIVENMKKQFSQMLKEIEKIQHLSLEIETLEKGDFKDHKLGEICEMRSGRPLPRDEDEFKSGNLPWVQIRDITNSSEFEIKSAEKNISTEFARIHNLTIIEEGTILVSVRGTLGTTGIAGTSMCIGPNVIALNVIDEHIDPWFLFGWFQKRKSMFQANAQGTIPMLTMSMLRNLTISIPSRLNQSVYINYSTALKNLQKLKQLSKDNSIQMDQMADSLFDNYFIPKA